MIATLTPLPSPHPGLGSSAGRSSTQWSVLPVSASRAPQPEPAKPAWPVLPASSESNFPTSWPNPLSVLPATTDLPAETPLPPEPAPVRITTPAPKPPAPAPAPAETSDFTDDDLRDAFAPIVEGAVRKAVYAQENGIDTYLEPMLRATIRRALAEYTPASRPFQAPGGIDRFFWHVQALFTSRTYDDILFDKTRRFQVEEVFLVDSATLSLVSFASCDPARHASARRIANTVHRLASQARDADGELRAVFTTNDGQNVISRQGGHTILMALVRGTPGELVSSDLEFSLRRIEDHFRVQLQQEGSDLLRSIQPFLEDCLLIQSPATSAN